MWFRHLLIVLLAIEMGAKMGAIGKHRLPITDEDAIFNFITTAFLIMGLLNYWK